MGFNSHTHLSLLCVWPSAQGFYSLSHLILARSLRETLSTFHS